MRPTHRHRDNVGQSFFCKLPINIYRSIIASYILIFIEERDNLFHISFSNFLHIIWPWGDAVQVFLKMPMRRMKTGWEWRQPEQLTVKQPKWCVIAYVMAAIVVYPCWLLFSYHFCLCWISISYYELLSCYFLIIFVFVGCHFRTMNCCPVIFFNHLVVCLLIAILRSNWRLGWLRVI